MFTRSELLKIAKSSDLYNFGVSLYELMAAKTQKDHISDQKIKLKPEKRQLITSSSETNL